VGSKVYVIDIAWQSVLYGLYSTKPEGRSPEGEGCISCTARDLHAICIAYPEGGGVCALLGSKRQRFLSIATRILMLQGDKL